MAAFPDSDYGGNRTGGPRRKQRILAVDDERHIVRLMQVNLERAGYEVVTAFDGREALEKIEAENPNLVITDLIMPCIDGFALLEILRKHQSTHDIPILMLFSRTQDADIFRLWQSGGDAYLLKPVNPVELLMLVKQILDNIDDSGSAPVPAAPAPLPPQLRPKDT